MTGRVTLESQTGERHYQQLVDGLLDWESVKEAFQARVVEIEDAGTPSLHRTGDRLGLTRKSFQANELIKVIVTKRPEHEHTAGGFRTSLSS